MIGAGLMITNQVAQKARQSRVLFDGSFAEEADIGDLLEPMPPDSARHQ